MEDLFVEEIEEKVKELFDNHIKWDINLPYQQTPNLRVTHDNVDITINDIPHFKCRLDEFNNHELYFMHIQNKFIFKYRKKMLTNIKNILDFTKKHGKEEEYLEIEKFIFEHI